MGEYVGLKIKNYMFIQYKNTFKDLLTIYSKSDLIKEKAIDDEGEEYNRYYFKTTIHKARMILDCLGHSLEEARRDFEINKRQELEFVRECEEDPYAYKCKWSSNDVEKNFTFETWVDAVHKYAKILANDQYDYYTKEYPVLEKERKNVQTVSEQIVMDSLPFGDGYFGIQYDENISIWNLFRVIIDAFEDNDEIILDYTSLYMGGWCDEYPEDKAYDVPKTIILTEGKFDVKVIKESMKILYPHMTKIFSFIDFSAYKVQGSTNFVTHYLKAFIAAGIQNRIIAIFDNDAAGKEETLLLSDLILPDNARYMLLPDIEIAKNYFTIGPNGKEQMNINGKACSIELYLGKDVLTKDDEFIPIQWTSYKNKIGTYQGEIVEKKLVQEKFERKIDKVKKTAQIEWENWNELDFLLRCIFNAFQNVI